MGLWRDWLVLVAGGVAGTELCRGGGGVRPNEGYRFRECVQGARNLHTWVPPRPFELTHDTHTHTHIPVRAWQALTYVFAGNDVAVEAIKFFVTKEVLVSSRVRTSPPPPRVPKATRAYQ